ncbi:hypothetical protein QQF64_000402, partial [Cirrhinus molitorella]
FSWTPGSSSPEPSCVSVKSDRSMPQAPNFSNEPVTSDPSISRSQRSSSAEPSYVSMKSDRSLPQPPNFSNEPVTPDP